MGQSSIPTLNKSGNSMYWNSMWDDKHNFEKSLNESLFLKEFIPAFFSNFSKKNFTKLLKNHDFSKKKLLKYKINIKVKFNLKLLINNLSKKKNFFISKIWIIKFQKFIIIYFFIYNNLLKKKTTHLKKRKPQILKSILNNYINSLFFIKLNKNSIKSRQFNKFNF